MRPFPIGNGSVTARVPREFAALMDALQLNGANTDALLALEDGDWSRLLEFCDLAHLTLALSQVELSGFPTWVIRRLGQNVSDNMQRFEHVKAAYEEAAAVLDRAGTPHVVLKGFTQVPEFVSGPHLRLQSDIDIYVPQHQIGQAQSALSSIGYSPVKGPDYSLADHVPSLSRTTHWRWRGNPYDPEMPPGIEIHYCLWNDAVSLIDLPEVKHFWERRVVRRFGDFEYVGLNPLDQFGYFALHILRCVLSGDWVVHHVRELATFLNRHAKDSQFWSQWQRAHSAELRKVEVLTCCLARDWFSCALSDAVRFDADHLPETQKKWLRRFSGSPLEVMFRRNKDGHLLHILLSTSRKKRQSLLRRAIIPRSVASPGASAVRVRYRRVIDGGHFEYARYLISRSLANLRADSALLLHGVTLWLSTRGLRNQLRLFIGAYFF